MIEAVQEAAIEAAELNAAIASTQTEAAGLNVAMQTEAPSTREFGVQASPIQDENVRLATVLRYTYASFLSLEKQDRLLNSHVERPPVTPSMHTQIMAKIDSFFVDNLNDIDPAIIVYLTELRSNTVTLTRFDRIRMSLMSLEIDRKTVEYEQKRLRQSELANRAQQKKMVCNICMCEITPGQKLLFGDCGHLSCKLCIVTVLSNPRLANRCGVCRHEIALASCITAKFKFNMRHEPVCRQCYKPFNDDGAMMKMIRCGHVYHDKCMHDKCMLCGFENIAEGSNIPLFVRWN